MAGVSPAFGGPWSFGQPNHSDIEKLYMYNKAFAARLQVNILSSDKPL